MCTACLRVPRCPMCLRKHRLRRLEQGNKLALLIGARLAEDAGKVGASRAEADTSPIWFSKCAAGAKTSGRAVQLWVASIPFSLTPPRCHRWMPLRPAVHQDNSRGSALQAMRSDRAIRTSSSSFSETSRRRMPLAQAGAPPSSESRSRASAGQAQGAVRGSATDRADGSSSKERR